MDGVPEAMEAGTRLGVRVVAGVELSAVAPSGSLHLLGYFSEAVPAMLMDRLAALRRGRVGRARAMVDRLAALGMPLEWDDVASRARGSLGRPHIADALVAAGHVSDRAEAFARYLGDDGPAYVPSAAFAPEDAIGLVREAGGSPVLAHPYSLRMGRDALRAFTGALVDLGLCGIEVYRPDHDAPDTEALVSLASDLGLVATGGSDFHRPEGPVELGDTGPQPLPSAAVETLLARSIR